MHQLKQAKQCANCPWRIGSDTAKIPNYDLRQHRQLASTIAKPGQLDDSDTLRMMACHNSSEGNDLECVGWLYNQCGVGNNIPLRIRLVQTINAKNIQVFGEQHKTFDATFTDE
jgi:Family of unknown function (DUF6283)